MTPAEWDAVTSQWQAFCTAMATVPGPTWVSDPHALARAEDKALQIHEARRVGFTVPETMWTNDRTAAEGVLARWGRPAFVKSVATAYWEEDVAATFVFGRQVASSDLPSSTRLAAAPLAFQELVSDKVDIRITIVGEEAFAAECEASPSGDWRLERGALWREHDVPTDIADMAVTLVRRLDLQFAGIDLVRSARGEYTFLEVNPNGEWGWLEKNVGLPIAATLADLLTA